MRIRLALLAALLVLPACGEPDPAEPPPAAPPAAAQAAEEGPGDFRLVVAGEGRPGARAPVQVDGDRAGVVLRFLRCRDTLGAFQPDPSPEAPAIEWEEVAETDAGAPMPRLGPGLYRVVAARDDREEEARLLVADLVPVVATSPNEILVLVTDAVSGRAIPGARVLVQGPGEARSGAADAEGVFRASFRVSGRLRIVVAAEGRVGQTLFTTKPHAAATTEVRIVFDQEVYAPGGAVRFAGLVRDSERLRPVRVAVREFSVRDGRGTLFYRGELEDGPAGLFSGAFPIPETCRAGRLLLSIGEGGPDRTAKVWVREPAPPRTALAIEVSEGVHVRGAAVGFEIRGEWSDGAPLAGVEVAYRVLDPGGGAGGGTAILDGRAVLDDRGRLSTSYVPPRGGENRITARAEIPGVPGVTAAETVLPRPAVFALKVTASSRHLAAGQPVRVLVSASPEQPDPVAARLEAGGETRDILVPSEIDLDLPPGMHRIRVVSEDSIGNPVEGECGVLVLPEPGPGAPEWSGSINLIADRDEYRPGDTARVLVSVPAALAGESILLSGDGPELGRHRVLDGSVRNLVVPVGIPRDAVRDQEIVVRTVRNRRIREERASLTVAGDLRRLSVGIRIDGENLLTLEARDSGGRPVEGVAILAVTDEEGRSRGFSPGLRLGEKGRSAEVEVRGPGRLTARAVVFTPDGRRGEASMVLANGPAAAGNPRPSPASAPTEARWIHRSARLPDGRSEWSLDLPEGAESLVIHLAGGPKAALRQALEALRGFEDWPAERLRNELLALEVEFLLAMAGDGEPPAADRFARALAGLAVIGEPGGALTVPVEVAKDFAVRALLEILGVENGAGGPVRRPDETELEALLAGRKGTGWGSARATAEAVRILAGAVRLSDERTASLRIRFGAALVGACRLDAETGPTVIVPRELLRPGRERLVFEKGGDLPVDCALSIGIHSGAPLRDGPIRVERAWRSTGEQPAAPHRGEIVTVALTVRSAETRERVVVECPVPAGSRALSGGPNPPVGVHREIRPDRVLFYLPKVGEKPVVLIQELLVTHGGEFLFPRAVAYPVDRPEERSESGEEMLTFR